MDHDLEVSDGFDLGTRLSEINPDHFWRYYDHFVRYSPKNKETGYYVKWGYDRPWHQAKSRDAERRTLHLWEERAVELTERHLDPDKWEWWKQSNGERETPPGLQWLGFFRASHTMFNLIDFDAKDFIIGWYTFGHQRKPVVIPTVEHFHKLKAIYDAFPDRVWCVSSDTLGVHAWERHELDPSDDVHERQKRVLQRIGLGSTEVHPMQGRCLRRPFGVDYRTITPDGVLEYWPDQLDYWDYDQRTPSFRQIAMTLLRVSMEEVNAFRSCLTCYGTFGRIPSRHTCSSRDCDKFVSRLAEVKRWLDDGCPQPAGESISVRANHDSTLRVEPVVEDCPEVRINQKWFSANNELGWVERIVSLAKHGLCEPNSVGHAACELAKWLVWVELAHMPMSERVLRTETLLTEWISLKHNGFSTRWNNGERDVVISQIGRAVQSVVNQDSEIFQRLRDKRQSGMYRTNFEIAPFLLGQQPASTALSFSSSSSSLITSLCKAELDTPLPAPIIHRLESMLADMRDELKRIARKDTNDEGFDELRLSEIPDPKRSWFWSELRLEDEKSTTTDDDGKTTTKTVKSKTGVPQKNKLLPFATRLLNHIRSKGGSCHLHQDKLLELFGNDNSRRMTQYRKIIEVSGLLRVSKSYRTGKASKQYKLTPLTIRAFAEQARNNQNRHQTPEDAPE